jgi:hypothetical protein
MLAAFTEQAIEKILQPFPATFDPVDVGPDISHTAHFIA